jgi:hypothetical protein
MSIDPTTPTAQRRRRDFAARSSLLMSGAWARVAGAAGLLAVLWLAVVWALSVTA